MTKPKPKKDESGGDTKGKDAGDGAKKKAAPKPRKRKVSDVSSTPKLGAAATSKKAASEESKGDRSADRAGGATNNTPAVDPNAAAAAVIKPFVKGELIESIKHMMFGFGDESEPLTESAELMEELVVEHVNCMTKKAMEIAQIKGKLDPECFTFLISKDAELYERINELLRANDEFRAVLNSGFDPSDEKMY